MSHRQQLLATAAMLTLSLSSPSTAAHAQNREPLRQPSAIPVDLALGLMSAGGFGLSEGDPQILVGSFPEWFASRAYLPAGARVLGSAFLGSTVVGVMTVPTSDSLMQQLERGLAQRGWKSTPPLRPAGGGFRPSPSSVTPGQRLTVCGDKQALSSWVPRRTAGLSTVVMRLSASNNVGLCTPPPQFAMESQRPNWPTLFDPRGTSESFMRSSCSQYFGGRSTTETRLNTTLSAQAILDHYGRQLQDSGWSPASEGSAVVGRTWTRIDSAGAPLQVTLNVSAAPNDTTCRTVEMRIQTVRRP